MPEPSEPRRSMVGVPPTARKPRGSATPSNATPSRTSARSAKRQKKEENVEKEEVNSDAEKDSEEEQEEDSGDEDATPSRKSAAKRKKKAAPLTDYHLKKKKILARKAQRDVEKEKEKASEESETSVKAPTPEPVRKAPSFSSYTALQLMQDHILRKIMSKDPEEYFMFPVTSSMAPDYHEIIKKPMDFQTIRENIEDAKYESIVEMRDDFKLIVDNAMQYNQHNTVFYLAANRLSALINYYFGEQYLRYLFHMLPFANEIPLENAGLTPLAPVPKNAPVNQRKLAIRDGMSVEDIRAKAGDAVFQRLKKPNAKLPQMAHIGEKAPGMSILHVLSEDGITPTTEQKMTLLDYIGPLDEGAPGMIQMGEHRLYSQTPVNYLNYGEFSTFAPQYDTTWATMTPEDSHLFLGSYGDRDGLSVATSMRKFSKDTGLYMMKVVDDLLDTLTDGEHRKTLKATKDVKDSELDDIKTIDELAELEAGGVEVEDYEFNDLLQSVSSLKNIGIDTSFLDELNNHEEMQQQPEPQDQDNEILEQKPQLSVQQHLNTIGQAILDLSSIQENRLEQTPPSGLISAAEPSIVEQKLAETVQTQLVEQIAQHVTPADMVKNENVLHNAMGIDPDDDLFSEFFVTQ